MNPLSIGDVGRTQKKLRDRRPEVSDLQTFLGNFEDNFLNDDVHPIKLSSLSVTELVDMGAFNSVNRKSLASILLKQFLERSPSRTAPPETISNGNSMKVNLSIC